MADTETACSSYQCYMITTFQDTDKWWSRARGVKEDAGGDRPVLDELGPVAAVPPEGAVLDPPHQDTGGTLGA